MTTIKARETLLGKKLALVFDAIHPVVTEYVVLQMLF